MTDPCYILKWGKAYFRGMRWELVEVNWEILFAGKGMRGRCVTFKSKYFIFHPAKSSGFFFGCRVRLVGLGNPIVERDS